MGSIVSVESWERERKGMISRGERPPEVEYIPEPPKEKNRPQTIVGGEPIPDKYKWLIPFIGDEPLPPEVGILLPAIEVAEGERKIDAVLRRLAEGVGGIQDSIQFRLYLTTMSKFHNYSISNMMLIMLQKSNATHVAGFVAWKDFGRWVKEGEKGIAILAPIFPPKATCPKCGTRIPKSAQFCPKCAEPVEVGEIEITPRYFDVKYVFDISQTEGKPLPEFEVPVLTGEANEELFSKVLALAKAQGLDVSFESRPGQAPSIKGQYFGKTIWVRPEESRAQQLKSLFHEVAHYYSEGVFGVPRRDAETIAESAAFAVGAHYGFDSGVRSFPYVALWAQDKKVLQQNLESIRKVAKTILESLEKTQGTGILPQTKQEIEDRKESWKYLTKLEKPILPKFRETFGLMPKDKMGTIQTIIPKYKTHMFDFLVDTEDKPQSVFVWSKGFFPAFEYFMENTIADWSAKMDVPKVDYIITDYNSAIFYSTNNQIVIPVKLVRGFKEGDKEFMGLLYFIAHEFCHWAAEKKKLVFPEPEDEERFANKTAEELSGIMWEDAIVSLHNLLPEVWETATGNRSLQEAIEKVKAAKSKGNYLARTQKAAVEKLVPLIHKGERTWYLGEWWEQEYSTADAIVYRSADGKKCLYVYWDGRKEVKGRKEKDEKLLPALKPFEPYTFVEYVLRNNVFNDYEIPIYSGLTGMNPLRVPDQIWAEVLAGMEGEFIKTGDLYVVKTHGVERPPDMRAAPTWREISPLVSTEPEFTPSTINDPLRKFCCRQCGECAPSQLLEEGKFPERIDWLRHHYKAKHPGMWGETQLSTSAKPFIKVGDRVRFTGPWRTRYETWPKDAWLEKGVTGTVKEYGPEEPALRVGSEYFKALPPYAVVRWDFGGNTLIDPQDEGKGWERIHSEKPPAVIPTQPLPPNPKEELEFISDSPEFLAYTIEDIGYRDKLDKAFEVAIARAKGG